MSQLFRMRWPKYWSFSFSIIPSKEIPGLIFRMDWLDLLAVQGTLKSLKGIQGKAKRGREQNERERPGAPRMHQATGRSQSAHCRPQGQSRKALTRNLWISGPEAIHQRSSCCGASPWGVRGLAQAWLQAVAVGNPGWVLSCLSWSLLGTQTHGDTHTQRETSVTCRPGPASASEHKWGLRPRLVVRDLGPSFPSQGTLAAPLKKPQLPPTPLTNWFNRKQCRAASGPHRQHGAGCHLPAITPRPNLSPSCSKAWIWAGLIPSLCSSSSRQAASSQSR